MSYAFGGDMRSTSGSFVANVNLSVRWMKHIPCSSNLQHPYECSLKFYQRYLVEYLITSLEHNARNSYFALLGPGAAWGLSKFQNCTTSGFDVCSVDNRNELGLLGVSDALEL